jgi:tetratricopeptide (TPR) repeat protein
VLTSFYRDGADNAELLTRDLGLALAQLVDGGKAPAPRVAPRGVALLASAVGNDPEDWPAWEAQAQLLTALGRRGEALADCQRVLAGAPRRETALADGAALARQLGQRDLAIDYWRRASAVNPWAPEYRGGLATLLAAKEAWDEVRPVCREWLRLDPASVEARMLWVTALLRAGRKDEARAEFDKVKALRPPNFAKLQAWFARESR